jgi:hypothetical protein
MNRGNRGRIGWLLALGCWGSNGTEAAEPAPDTTPWCYQLIAGARLLDDCSVCDRLPLEIPLRGGFEVRLAERNPLFDRYELGAVRFTDGAEPPGYELTGRGTFTWGGEVALVQEWSLEGTVRTPAGARAVVLRSPLAAVKRLWPMLAAELVEEDGTPESRLFLTLVAAPLRELWFTTDHGMTSGLGEWPTNRIRSADLLARPARIVREGVGLMKMIGLAGDDVEADIDAFTIPAGRDGELWFSLDRDVVSATLGPLGEGDLLSARGTVVQRNADLLRAFGFMPPLPDLGLDAVEATGTGFRLSIRTPQFSERLGVVVGRGDVLTSDGRLERTHWQLLERFKPEDPDHDYGLDGFYFWPSGEVWFTTEEGFQDAVLGYVTDGDLLSDQGYVVAPNLDLVREFQPLEDLANFGLQGFWVISDAAAVAGPGVKLRIAPGTAGEIVLSWAGEGRVHQVEAADRCADPFQPVTPLLFDTAWSESRADPARAARFYRVRTW